MALKKRRLVLTLTGTLTIAPGGARLDGEILVTRAGGPRAAAIYLKRLGFKDGDRVRVIGAYRTVGGKTVFSITSVKKITSALPGEPGVGVPKGRRKKTAAKSFIKRAVKKSVKKKLRK